MSPEQVRAQDVDARTDLFSFGVVLYEMATGTLPFRGESQGVIFEAILNRAPAPLRQLNPDLPPELERIVDKCLEKDRELRYQHASEIRADLQRLKRDRDSGRVAATAPADAPRTIVRRWKIWSSAAAVVVAAALAGVWYFHRPLKLTDKDTHRPRRFHQHHGRSGVRRHAATGTGGTARAIAVPQPGLGRAHPENAGADEPAGGCAADC